MKLSIITVNKNNAPGLEKTIKSVVCQTFRDFEYIVIDGASTDGSVNIIKEYVTGINYWVSEADTGIYSAMNKGIQKAAGEYCLFLNSADCLISPTTLENVFNEIDMSSDIYYSDLQKSNFDYTSIPVNANVNYIIGNTMNHQNMLIRRTLFCDHGFYDENISLVADTEFLLRETWVYKVKLKHINTNIALYDISGLSGWAPSDLINREREIICSNIFGELGPSIFELYQYRTSLYGSITKSFGCSKFLVFLLRLYRFLACRLKLVNIKI
ncbi:glycosyl transferase [Spirochaetia bacterium]|nr:glycosyl transferase [Spirochaetia bacterium]